MGKARQHGCELNTAEASLLTTVPDPEQLERVFPEVNIVLWAARYLKTNHLSVFAGPAVSEMGKPLEEVFPVAPSGDCTGALESVVPLVDPRGRGLRFTGWAWDVKHRRSPSAIVVTTNGTITGMGAVGGWRPDIAATQAEASRSHPGYIAYVSEPSGISIVNLYAILRGTPSTACHFATK